MISIFFFIAALWTGWLLLDGFLSGEVWVKGGAKDRFTRPIDMKSFAHKVSRENNKNIYWLNIFFYSAATILFLYIALTNSQFI